jgi:divalent metal cation (Fe/Co/Zn/Cd) transporter
MKASRPSNLGPHSDIAIEVDPTLSVAAADALAKEVEGSVRNHVPLLGSVVVRVLPATK